ncbi:MAG: transcriptional repressor [Candidatus Omnitrophica bacterium]|nr:transcriptional repressor [Candidatus Omnitrophota bacterium]
MARGCRREQNLCHGRFKEYGYRLTMSRQAILDVLSKTKDHLSAEEIYHEVHKVYPSSGMSTVYRTLELLVDLGIVHKFHFGDGRSRYEIDRGEEHNDHHHHHLVCTKCQRVINYTDFIDDEIELLRRTEKGLSKKYNFKIVKHILQFYGLCERCKEKQ